MKKKKGTDITVVLPVHELDDKTKDLYGNAIKSIEMQKVRPDEVIIVVPKGSDIKDFVSAFDYEDVKALIRVVENDGETDFASQLNYGVSQANTAWFSFLEYDDEYQANWFKNVVKYIDAHDDVEIFLPIIVDVDGNNQFIGFTNEAVWANKFSDEIGVLDNSALLRYQNFNIDGFVMKKDVYESKGRIKPSIKLTFIYEFLLRMTFNDVRIMTIPKFGYKHMNQREGSLFHTYKEQLNPAEAQWWLSQAKKEYYFPHDRNITYDE